MGITDPLYLVLVNHFIGLIFILLIVYFYNKTAFKIAVNLKARFLNVFYGFLLGTFLVVIGFSILVLSDQIKIVQILQPESIIIFGLLFLSLAAFDEELFFRVLLINHLRQRFNVWFSILISASVFLLFHLSGLTNNYLGMFNVFCGGVLLGCCYLLSKNIWLPWAFHLAWNFSQGIIFGIGLDGIPFQSIIKIQLNGPPFLTGGKSGYEASLVGCLLIATTAVVFIYRLTKSATT